MKINLEKYNKVLIKTSNLCKDYGEGTGITHALSNVDLEIYEGELLCILGGSGSGKSTLLNLIAGLDKATSGSVMFLKEDITKLSDNALATYRENKIGFVFQFFNLIDEINVYQNLTILDNSNDNKKDIEALLNKLGIKDKLYKYPRELSGGEQQRVSFARALNKPSNILLCDEPTGALDYQSGKEILQLIEKIHHDEKKTIVIVTHTKEIARMCDRTIMLKSGKIVGDVINISKRKAKDIEW